MRGKEKPVTARRAIQRRHHLLHSGPGCTVASTRSHPSTSPEPGSVVLDFLAEGSRKGWRQHLHSGPAGSGDLSLCRWHGGHTCVLEAPASGASQRHQHTTVRLSFPAQRTESRVQGAISFSTGDECSLARGPRSGEVPAPASCASNKPRPASLKLQIPGWDESGSRGMGPHPCDTLVAMTRQDS